MGPNYLVNGFGLIAKALMVNLFLKQTGFREGKCIALIEVLVE